MKSRFVTFLASVATLAALALPGKLAAQQRLIQRAGSKLEAHARLLLRKRNSSMKKSRDPIKFRRFLSDRLLEFGFAEDRRRFA
jgi:hypothetical protein